MDAKAGTPKPRCLRYAIQVSSGTSRTASSTASKSAAESTSICSARRCFATARIWSITATTGFPAHVTGTRSGGRAWGEDERGTTTTVRLRSLRIFVVSIRHGRVFPNSEPWPGPSLTHQTSPRWGTYQGSATSSGSAENSSSICATSESRFAASHAWTSLRFRSANLRERASTTYFERSRAGTRPMNSHASSSGMVNVIFRDAI